MFLTVPTVGSAGINIVQPVLIRGRNSPYGANKQTFLYKKSLLASPFLRILKTPYQRPSRNFLIPSGQVCDGVPRLTLPSAA